jgi:signal transduction histidine kinase
MTGRASKHAPLSRRYLLRIISPTILISALLFGLGVVAAWNVQRQQATSSEVIAREVHNLLAAEDLLLVVPELRHLLQQYLRTGEQQYLDQAGRLEPTINEHLTAIHASATAPGTVTLLSEARTASQEFFIAIKAVNTLPTPDARSRAIEALLDDLLDHRILRPTREFVDLNRQVVDRTNDANRHTADQMRQAFLLLGLCGGGAGLVAGLSIARGLGRSIVQLDVSVRGAAGKLQEVVGPVTISHVDGFHHLERGLREIEANIATVVERLQQRELEILHQQQLAAVGQLAAGLAHELRNPLMPMKMLVQKALARPDDAGMKRHQLEVISEEIQRLEKLISEFLDFARPQALEKRSIELDAVVRQAIDLVAPRAAAQQIEIQAQLPREPVFALADPARIQQVLLNLLLNSLDAMPEAGQIQVSLEQRPLRNAEGDRIVVRVSDSGRGIMPELLPRLFEPFVSTKPTGTGLGLTISQRIIEDHDGTLSAANRPEGGALFEISLPLPRSYEPAPVPLPPLAKPSLHATTASDR